MKKVKFFILVCVVACLSIGSANAQLGKYGVKWTEILPVNGWFDCMDEPISGDVYAYYTVIADAEGNWTEFHNRFNGTLTGEFSGDIYTLSEIQHQKNIVNRNAANWNFLGTFVIEKDGNPVLTFHMIINGRWNGSVGYTDLANNLVYKCD